MTTALDVHIKDCGGREFGGQYSVGQITTAEGRVIVQLDYCGSKSSKRLTTAWLDIDRSVVQDILKAMDGADVTATC
jgi:hypothetical protein